MFPMDSELGDEYYMKYYADTNDTMYMCTPYIPVRPDMRRKYAQTHPHIYSMVGCIIYQLGYLEKLYKHPAGRSLISGTTGMSINSVIGTMNGLML